MPIQSGYQVAMVVVAATLVGFAGYSKRNNKQHHKLFRRVALTGGINVGAHGVTKMPTGLVATLCNQPAPLVIDHTDSLVLFLSGMPSIKKAL